MCGHLARAGAAAWALLGIAAVVFVSAWLIGRLMAVIVPFAVALLLATLLRPWRRVSNATAFPGPRRDDRGGARRRRARAAPRADPAAVHRPAGDLGASLRDGGSGAAYSAGESVAGMDRAR